MKIILWTKIFCSFLNESHTLLLLRKVLWCALDLPVYITYIILHDSTKIKDCWAFNGIGRTTELMYPTAYGKRIRCFSQYRKPAAVIITRTEDFFQSLFCEQDIPPKPFLEIDMAAFCTVWKLMIKSQDKARKIWHGPYSFTHFLRNVFYKAIPTLPKNQRFLSIRSYQAGKQRLKKLDFRSFLRYKFLVPRLFYTLTPNVACKIVLALIFQFLYQCCFSITSWCGVRIYTVFSWNISAWFCMRWKSSKWNNILKTVEMAMEWR